MSSAREYAELVAKTLREYESAGHPFGYDEERIEYGQEPEVSAWDYLESALEIKYIIGSDLEYQGALVWMTLGGTDSYIDTFRGVLVVSRGFEEFTQGLPGGFIDRLNEVLKVKYGMER